jgi:hypothetical protein
VPLNRLWKSTVPARFPSPWRYTDRALSETFRGVTRDKFGSCDVLLPDGSSHNVRDMQYDLGDGTPGMFFVPVNDKEDVHDEQGQTVDGYTVMAKHLREKMGLAEEEPIFAFAAYVHPEEHTGNLNELGTTMVKTEAGNTHLGAFAAGYIYGPGETVNSPEAYHSRQFEVKGYPANMAMISLEGVRQALLHKNGMLAAKVLNREVQFPGDYKNDKFRTIDLNANLAFYRDWLRSSSKDPQRQALGQYVKEEPSWFTYCAEHQTIIANVMANLGHNPEAFRLVYGEEEGARLWDDFTARFAELNGRDFTQADETKFEMLWQKEGLQPEKLRPLSREEMEAYHDARTVGKLDEYEGPRPLPPGAGMCWPPETTADLLNDFVQMYASFVDTNAFIASSVVMGFKDVIKARLGITDQTYLGIALPVVSEMLLAEARVSAPGKPEWMNQAFGNLYVAFGGSKEDLAPSGQQNPQIAAVVKQALAPVQERIEDIQGGPAISREEAYEELVAEIQDDLERARAVAASDAAKVDFYSPPAILHRIALGMHEKSRFITVKELCTAVDSSEVELAG